MTQDVALLESEGMSVICPLQISTAAPLSYYSMYSDPLFLFAHPLFDLLSPPLHGGFGSRTGKTLGILKYTMPVYNVKF